jgi:two-component system chemotaxis response regulator CheB
MTRPQYPARVGTTAGERYDVVAVASSAGGIRTLRRLLGSLPADLPVPLLIVQHLRPDYRTHIAEVIARRTELTTKLAENEEHIKAGVAYFAPPDHHLLVTPGGKLTLTHSEPVHFVRPSANLLFQSVAGAYGPHAIACVLSGAGTDGAIGVTAVKAHGGTVIVQDPQSALFDGMPLAAITTGAADLVLPLDEIADAILRLTARGRPDKGGVRA